ncbi:MAG: hypothetical protein D6687_04190 [Acidobacteria bacterium]|jgi:hypothetical protein|nr:MAG: hypothetical protein D6687_04190 [Acidobacteriota bacterium]
MDKQTIYCRDPETGAPWALDTQPKPIAEAKRKRQPVNIQRESLDTDTPPATEESETNGRAEDAETVEQ